MSWMLSTTSLLRPTPPVWLENVCQRLIDDDATYSEYTTVELTHPRMDDRDAKIFAKALSDNKIITTLIISCYAIVDDGTAAIGLALSNNKSITKLQLRDLRDVREISTFFHYLEQNNTITELSLRHCTICPRGAIAMAHYLKKSTTIRELRITDSQFISNAFQLLCEQSLYRHTTIQRLYFVNDDLTYETSAEYIASIFDQNSTLQELSINENNLGDDGVAIIVTSIIQNSATTVIQVLDLRSNDIACDGAMSLQGLIVNNTSLRSLNISHNELGDRGMMALSRGLQQQTSRLTTLDVNTNDISIVGATAIGNMLRMNQSLHKLNLSFNSLGDDGVVAIASALASNSITKLRTLSLRRNGVTNFGAKSIAKLLPHMKGLKELILSKNEMIDHIGTTAILHGLRSNVELEYLDVDDKKTSPSFSETQTSSSGAPPTATSNEFSVVRDIACLLKLNKGGRRVFQSINSIPRPLWSYIYGRICNDTDTLFHFLTAKPDIFSLPHPPTSLQDQYDDFTEECDKIHDCDTINATKVVSTANIDFSLSQTKTRFHSSSLLNIECHLSKKATTMIEDDPSSIVTSPKRKKLKQQCTMIRTCATF